MTVFGREEPHGPPCPVIPVELRPATAAAAELARNSRRQNVGRELAGLIGPPADRAGFQGVCARVKTTVIIRPSSTGFDGVVARNGFPRVRPESCKKIQEDAP